VGTIKVFGKIVSNIKGSYLGQIYIDDKKYYDVRYDIPHRIIIKKSFLPSDWNKRKDL